MVLYHGILEQVNYGETMVCVCTIVNYGVIYHSLLWCTYTIVYLFQNTIV